MAILVLIHEGLTVKRIPLNKPEISIGRKIDADIYIDDKLVSQNHAKIDMTSPPDGKDGADYYIEDLGSTNQTFVNNEAVTRKKLVHEDIIRIGKHAFKFIEETAALGDKTTKLHKSWIPGVYYTKE
jgi:pSer/pThr/pTyr-binding forkhead associated (FHA) protein